MNRFILLFIAVFSCPLANLYAQGNEHNFKIGILLPFSTNGSDKENKNAEAIFDYYQGAKLALNQLEKEGFKSTVQVWDLNKDSLELEKLFKSTEFQGLDLLIGPISQKYVNQILL